MYQIKNNAVYAFIDASNLWEVQKAKKDRPSRGGRPLDVIPFQLYETTKRHYLVYTNLQNKSRDFIHRVRIMPKTCWMRLN